MPSRLGIFAILLCLTQHCLAQPTLLPNSGKNGWAYRLPVRPPLPTVTQRDWPRNSIDSLILVRLETERLVPAPEATKELLLRRTSLSLTGLPPTLDELDDFLSDEAPNAFDRRIERLLASPRFGERMATPWLDLARYADTHGYHADTHRDMWRWRDWVIEAFNRNLPFDQFTIEQLAGDLLPNATREQHIATGFNRNHMVNFENGAIPEEYRVEYVADRVQATSTVWLGQTLHCARCHDHKHDPFSQRDYYRLFALFNNVAETGLDGQKGNAAPFIVAPTRLQQQTEQQLTQQLTDAEQTLERQLTVRDHEQHAWEQRLLAETAQTVLAKPAADPVIYLPLDETEGSAVSNSAGESAGTIFGEAIWGPGKLANGLIFDGETHVSLPKNSKLTGSPPLTLALWIFPTTGDETTLVRDVSPIAKPTDKPGGYELFVADNELQFRVFRSETEALHVKSLSSLKQNKWQHIALTYDGTHTARGVQFLVNGQLQPTAVVTETLPESVARSGQITIGRRGEDAGFRGKMDDVRIYSQTLSAEEVLLLAEPNQARRLAEIPLSRRTADEARTLRRHFLESTSSTFREIERHNKSLRRDLDELRKTFPTAMVMQELVAPRETHVLLRGQYDQPGDSVVAGLPTLFEKDRSDQSVDRLAFARWLVSPQQPLTSRVTVNRFWQLVFGAGLVATPDDFGLRGEPPSHPELLDWLACDFEWDTKRLFRMLVSSATFRQSSRVTPELWHRDPNNRWLARFARPRLPAEMIRDSALAASGLLQKSLGGASVFPYQPAGLWEEVAYDTQHFTAQEYKQSHGADLYRRSLYTFWKRSVPAPALAIFDTPDREVCTTVRPESNTPLQSLVLMNETAFIEAARALAVRLFVENESPQPTFESRLVLAYRLVLSRRPDHTETSIMKSLWQHRLREFRDDPAAATKFIRVGESVFPATLDPVELAAWTSVTSTLFSLDEALVFP